mmetsp:Transcript_33785/g.73856  ORF Transcript_33785/g.73856 Transcript_33785/m.73856 type:complete len:81 (-) Transcript_33785:617-859(-)
MAATKTNPMHLVAQAAVGFGGVGLCVYSLGWENVEALLKGGARSDKPQPNDQAALIKAIENEKPASYYWNGGDVKEGPPK